MPARFSGSSDVLEGWPGSEVVVLVSDPTVSVGRSCVRMKRRARVSTTETGIGRFQEEGGAGTLFKQQCVPAVLWPCEQSPPRSSEKTATERVNRRPELNNRLVEVTGPLYTLSG